MIQLHHCLDARSFRPLWMLEELDLPYALTVWPFPPRARDKRYFEVNPLGTVPAFFDGEVAMTESVAICHYLAVRHAPGRLEVGAGEPDFGRYLNDLHYGEATLTFPQALVLRYSRFEPPERRQPQVVDDYARWFAARLRPLAARLAQHEFLCAQRFTAADISVGYALMLASTIGLDSAFAPEVAAYWQRLQARPAWQRARAAQHDAAVAQGLSTASPIAA